MFSSWEEGLDSSPSATDQLCGLGEFLSERPFHGILNSSTSPALISREVAATGPKMRSLAAVAGHVLILIGTWHPGHPLGEASRLHLLGHLYQE